MNGNALGSKVLGGESFMDLTVASMKEEGGQHVHSWQNMTLVRKRRLLCWRVNWCHFSLPYFITVIGLPFPYCIYRLRPLWQIVIDIISLVLVCSRRYDAN